MSTDLLSVAGLASGFGVTELKIHGLCLHVDIQKTEKQTGLLATVGEKAERPQSRQIQNAEQGWREWLGWEPVHGTPA